ncbi:MAG: NAD(P)/FAD-dependent oxidoreductase [Solirubrobacteraceae bacterium]|nr:NAD(P)/FAD-dependent oxidoreductase [Solirubrobacteraceae bacterium]
MTTATETFDAIVVGARCAGCATAIALARAGKRVIAVDRTAFPSDTLSTHLLFAGGVSELKELGALERAEASGAPRAPAAFMAAKEMEVTAGYTPNDQGINYGLSVRRIELDMALVETAREAGAEVREKTKVTELLWENERVVGVTATGEDGEAYELRAPLVVGADGRKSFVARQLGVDEPYKQNPNKRACVFAYWKDNRPEWRPIMAQWREGDELGTAFPCNEGLVMVLLMPPVEDGPEYRKGLEEAYLRGVDKIPALRERLDGCEIASKVRISTDHPAFFRRSSGPGWALPGDAGHFKDPVTAQGIRDALRYGRRLGEHAAPAIGDPVALDRALRAWEKEREDDCLEIYQWTNLLARAETMNPVEEEAYRVMSQQPGLARPMLDTFARTIRPSKAFSPAFMTKVAVRAVARPGRRPEAVKIAVREAKLELAARKERRAARKSWN